MFYKVNKSSVSMLHYEKPIIAFFEAIKNLRYRQVALILQTGFDPNLLLNAHNQNGLQFLVNYFGDTDARIRLQIPINKAAYINIAKLLLDSGLDANTIDLLSGESVMFDAIRYDDRDMVLLLLGYVDMSLRNKEGETALMFAARIGTRQVMKMMLEHLRLINMDGYFLRQRNRYGNTALELARASNLECAKVMTKHLIHYGNQSLGTYHQHQHLPILSRSSSHHQLLAAAAAGIPVVHNSSRYHHHRRAPSHHSLLSSVSVGLGETTTDDSDIDGGNVANDASLLYNVRHQSRNKHDKSFIGTSSNVSHRSFYNQGGQMAASSAASAQPYHHRRSARSKASDNITGAQAMISMNSDEEEEVAEAVAAANSGEEAVQAAVEAQQQRCQQQVKGTKGRSASDLRRQQQNEEDMGYMMDQFRGMRT